MKNKTLCCTGLVTFQTMAALIMLMTFVGCSEGSKNGLHLVTNGQSKYSILIPVDASPEEIRAAGFLTRHIRTISGFELPVIHADTLVSTHHIVISKSTEIDQDCGYRIFTQGNSLFIHGGKGKGCVFGVADILENHLGVRYYSPHYVVIPESDNVVIPSLNVVGSSPNTYRNVHGDFAKDEDYRDFHRLHTIDDMFATGYFVHTFHRLVPWIDYFLSNPEYFAWMNGKHIIDQLCLSNEEVFELVVEKLRSEMLLQPDRKVWSVSQDDNFSYCQCEDCSRVIEDEGSPSGPIIRFVNQVAEQFPDKLISTLAYQYSRSVPLKTKPRSNVQIMLCTIELSRSKPIATDTTSVSFLKDMEDWGKISNHIFLWDYTVNFNHHISPFPNLHTLQPNIQLFVANNVAEHFQQSNTGTGHEFSELKSYLLAKLLWNPDANKSKIIEEFTQGYYGAASHWIRQYIDALEDEILKTGEWLDIYGPPTNHQHTFLSAGNVERYNQFFDNAEQAVKEDPDRLLHVYTARMSLQYAIMEIGKNDMFGPRGWYKESDGEFVHRTHMTDMLESFYQTSIAANSAPVNEAGLKAVEYYQSTKRFLDVQVDGNFAFRKTMTAQPMPAKKYSNGDLSYLTNGVRGASDFKVHWMGWEAQDFNLILDLESLTEASVIEISSLWDQKSWILHPKSVRCLVSAEGITYTTLGTQSVPGDQRHEEVTRLFSFKAPDNAFRFVKFEVKGTLRLPDWHPSAGGDSWVFLDEMVVK